MPAAVAVVFERYASVKCSCSQSLNTKKSGETALALILPVIQTEIHYQKRKNFFIDGCLNGQGPLSMMFTKTFCVSSQGCEYFFSFSFHLCLSRLLLSPLTNIQS